MPPLTVFATIAHFTAQTTPLARAGPAALRASDFVQMQPPFPLGLHLSVILLLPNLQYLWVRARTRPVHARSTGSSDCPTTAAAITSLTPLSRSLKSPLPPSPNSSAQAASASSAPPKWTARNLFIRHRRSCPLSVTVARRGRASVPRPRAQQALVPRNITHRKRRRAGLPGRSCASRTTHRPHAASQQPRRSMW